MIWEQETQWITKTFTALDVPKEKQENGVHEKNWEQGVRRSIRRRMGIAKRTTL